jgi:hypothetical protein
LDAHSGHSDAQGKKLSIWSLYSVRQNDRNNLCKQRSDGCYLFQVLEQQADDDFATGFIILHDERELTRLILLLGYPNGFGEYRWYGICPHTLKPTQMLYLDPGTKLFVSRPAFGKSPPASIQRTNENCIILDKIIQKYGKFNWRDLESYPQITKDPDFTSLDDEDFRILVVWDFFFANNGYPIPIIRNGAIDVLATIQNSKHRQRRPAKLLKPNKAKPVRSARPYRTAEEVIERMREKNLPIPPGFEQQLRERFTYQPNKS